MEANELVNAGKAKYGKCGDPFFVRGPQRDFKSHSDQASQWAFRKSKIGLKLAAVTLEAVRSSYRSPCEMTDATDNAIEAVLSAWLNAHWKTVPLPDAGELAKSFKDKKELA